MIDISNADANVVLNSSSGNESSIVPTALTDKIFIGSISGILAVGGVEAAAVLLRNPTGSGKRLRLIRITTHVVATASQDISFRLRVSPVVSSTGAAGSIVQAHRGNSSVSSMQIFSAPTLSSFGTIVDVWSSSSGVIASTPPWRLYQDTLVLDSGHDLSLTGTPDGANRSFVACVCWLEE